MPKSDRIPLFPLSLVLFPEEILPLHIFEERYKELVTYCLEQDAPFGLVSIEDDKMAAVGCTARIRKVLHRYEDETLDIETQGETRFRIDALYDDASYATAAVTKLEDENEPVPFSQRERLVAQHMKLLELLGETIRPGSYSEEHLLSFRIAAAAGLDMAQRQRVLEITSEAGRINHLVEYFQDFIPRVQTVKQRQERIQSNGHFS